MIIQKDAQKPSNRQKYIKLLSRKKSYALSTNYKILPNTYIIL